MHNMPEPTRTETTRREAAARKVAAQLAKDFAMSMSLSEIEAIHEAQERIEQARRDAANVMRFVAKHRLETDSEHI